MVPPAPARFSTTTVWPRVGRMASASERATLSVGPPAANGTIILIGRSGYSPWAAPAAKSALAASSTDSVRGKSLMGSPVPRNIGGNFLIAWTDEPLVECHQLVVSVGNNRRAVTGGFPLRQIHTTLTLNLLRRTK